MKMNIRLGVPTADLLKSPTTCFRLSKAMSRVSDALAFGEHYITESKGIPIQSRDIQHMSASIWTSSRSAEDLANLIDDAELRLMVAQYAVDARRFNTVLRKALPAVKSKIKGAKPVKKPEKPMTEAQIAKKTADLRAKVNQIANKVESLCTIDKPAAPEKAKYVPPGSSLQGRAGMSGSGSAPKKRPMYPRYFVASMGRSRR